MLPDEAFANLARLAAAEGVEQLVVGGIVQHESAILLLKRRVADFMGGIWELPSGKVEPNETLDDALIREVNEETGLTVTDIRHYLGSFDYQSGSGKRSRQFNFVVDIAKSEPVKLTEHDAYIWAPVTDDLPVTDAVKAVLGKYREPKSLTAGATGSRYPSSAPRRTKRRPPGRTRTTELSPAARRARAGQPTVVPPSRLAGTCWLFFSALKSCRAWL